MLLQQPDHLAFRTCELTHIHCLPSIACLQPSVFTPPSPFSSDSGLYLQDLTFINFADDKLEDGENINFTKRWRQFNAVDKIRLAQTK